MCAKRKLLPRPRNAGTMTESAFWGMIRSALRQKSRWWKPIAEAKLAARRAYKGSNKRLKWEYKCAKCKKYFPGKDVQVDHIIPAGTLRTAEDLPLFVENLFCEEGGFQVLCTTCHNIKTQKERKKK